jgi:DNA-binding SARP family transcriptional activator
MLRTLGTVGLFSPDADAPVLGAGKPVALLVYMHALPGRRASREHLLDVLWADLEPTAARHALRQMTLFLRQRLGTPALEATDGELALMTSFASDRDAFLDAVEAGDLPRAVELYQGEFLPGFAVPGGIGFEHWADSERQRLRLLFQRSAESLARMHLKHGHFRHARDLARRARDEDPLDESGWRLLLEACLAHGDRVTALAEGQRLEQWLNAEGRLPEPATRAMLRQVSAQPDDTDQPGERTLVAELVGREREFAAILAAFGRARRGAAQVVSLVAPAGLGKTRLLRDVAQRLTAGGNTAAYVRAHPGDRDVPWSYAAEVVRELAARPGAGGVSPASAASLVALDPSLSARFNATPDSATGNEAYRRRTAAIAELVLAVSEERPLALLFDDQHWTDPISRDALQRVVPRVRGARTLLVFAARPGDALHRLEIDEAFSLAPLDSDQVGALVASFGALPEAPWTQGLGARLHAATAGSPLLLLETLQLALESGCLTLDSGHWSCSDQHQLDAMLEAGSALARRIAQLDRGEGWLLLLLALAGTPLKAEPIATAAGRDRERTVADLQTLERKGLVAHAGDDWSVAHDEIADQAIAIASDEQRSAAHSGLGRSLLHTAEERDALKRAAGHLATANLEHELAVAAARWVLVARSSGDTRPTSALVSDLLDGATEQQVRQLTRAIPWRLRVRRRMAVGAAIAALILLAATTVALLARPAAEAPDLVLGVWRDESNGWRLYARDVTRGDVTAGRLDMASLRATGMVSPDRPSGALRPGSMSTMATTRAFKDDGGEDVVLVTTDRAERRLTSQRGDDVFGAWSPDARYIVISTDRWSNSSASSLAIIDPEHPESVVTRLTNSQGSRDLVPLWSPDGTRIGFLRISITGTDLTYWICTITVDGTQERCTDAPGASVMGWASSVEMVTGLTGTDGIARFVAMNVETAAWRVIAEGTQGIQSPVAGWINCFCRRNGGEPEQALLIPVNSPERAIRLEPGDPPPDLMLASPTGKRGYLDRVHIRRPSGPIPVDHVYRMRLDGMGADGAPMTPQAVRWLSRDTLTAAVDSGGEIHPRRAGAVTIVATAGGWRSDSVQIQIGTAASRLVLGETWQHGIDSAWVPFGTPAPVVVRTDSGSYLAPNGDSTYQSGVFMRRLLPVSDGLGVEYLASVPLNNYQWQVLGVMMVSARAANPESWDLEKGHLRMASASWRSCEIAYPWSGGWPGRGQLSLTAGTTRRVAVPEGSGDGRPMRVRLQLFPDGRCGVAIDGVARLIRDRQVPMGDSAMLIISAYSHRTRILVGPVDVWTGVRGGVDWE